MEAKIYEIEQRLLTPASQYAFEQLTIASIQQQILDLKNVRIKTAKKSIPSADGVKAIAAKATEIALSKMGYIVQSYTAFY